MVKRVRRFLKEYKEFSFALIGTVIAAALALSGVQTAANYVLIFTALVIAIPLVADMLKTLRSGHFGIDVLAITAIVTSIILGEYWAAIIIVLMLTGGEALEDYAEKRAKNELSDLLKKRPKKAHLIKGKKTVDIKASAVNVGDRISVLPGEVIPVDGIITEGATSVDEASITGESLPIVKAIGEELVSGSLNLEGAIVIKATRSAADSQYEQIIKLVRSAAASHSPFVRLADRYSVPFTALAFLIAGAAWFISGDSMRFLEVLVVATPCPLILGAPIGIISGMSRASRNGIIIKTGSALEQLADVKTIAFDKTGTLTNGTPVIDKVYTYGNFKETDVLTAASSLEQSSNHILAAAIVDKASSLQLKVQPAKQVKEISGHGLSGRVKGKTVLVGHLSLMTSESVTLPEKFNPDSFKKTVSYIAVNGELAGAVTFKDEVRPEAAGMLKVLRRLGVRKFALVTGDNEASALSVAQKLDITDVYPDCLPADKMHAIDEMQAPVAFVGDGVNDAPVLTVANIGIALGARGSTAASETADVVIMHDNVAKVAQSVAIAKRTLFIAKQSVLIGIVISLGLMLAFSTGKFTAVQGALIQELVDIIVIINALRAHTESKKLKELQTI